MLTFIFFVYLTSLNPRYGINISHYLRLVPAIQPTGLISTSYRFSLDFQKFPLEFSSNKHMVWNPMVLDSISRGGVMGNHYLRASYKVEIVIQWVSIFNTCLTKLNPWCRHKKSPFILKSFYFLHYYIIWNLFCLR